MWRICCTRLLATVDGWGTPGRVYAILGACAIAGSAFAIPVPIAAAVIVSTASAFTTALVLRWLVLARRSASKAYQEVSGPYLDEEYRRARHLMGYRI